MIVSIYFHQLGFKSQSGMQGCCACLICNDKARRTGQISTCDLPLGINIKRTALVRTVISLVSILSHICSHDQSQTPVIISRKQKWNVRGMLLWNFESFNVLKVIFIAIVITSTNLAVQCLVHR